MTPIPRRGLCLVLAAPSGAGKSAIAAALLASEPDNCRCRSASPRARHGPARSTACTTIFATRRRSTRWCRRTGCWNGRACSRPAQLRHAARPVEAALAAGRDVAFDIDWQGHRQLRAALPGDVVGVFMLPPSLATLEARLRARAGDNEAEIARRMGLARDEISHWAEFDHVVVNDDLSRAVETVRAVLHAARVITTRQTGLAEFVRRLAD